MGQQISPIGFRVGITLKWKFSWYGAFGEKSIYLSKGLISPLGGLYLSNLEEIIQNLLKVYSYSKISKTYRIFILSFRLYKGYGGILYGFLVFNKLTENRIAIFN